MTHSRWARRSVVLLLLVLLIAGGLARLRITRLAFDPASMRDELRHLDAMSGGVPVAPVALVMALACILVVPIIPASVLQVASGLAFGPVWGLVYAMLADALGAAMGFALARRWGTRLLRRWLKPGVVAHVERLAQRLTWQGVILLRLLPGPAYPLVSFAAGISRLSLGRYLLASLAGVLPAMALLVYAGDVATGSPLLAGALVAALVASLLLAGRLIRTSRTVAAGEEPERH